MDDYMKLERRSEADRTNAVIAAIVDHRYLAPGMIANEEWRQRVMAEAARGWDRIPGSVSPPRRGAEALRRGASTWLTSLRSRLQDVASANLIPRRKAAPRAGTRTP